MFLLLIRSSGERLVQPLHYLSWNATSSGDYMEVERIASEPSNKHGRRSELIELQKVLDDSLLELRM